MYTIKNNELVYSGDTIKEKIEIFIGSVWFYVKQAFPCLYYNSYVGNDGSVHFAIYRKWFGYMFAIQEFPIGCGYSEEFLDEENVDNNDDMEE